MKTSANERKSCGRGPVRPRGPGKVTLTVHCRYVSETNGTSEGGRWGCDGMLPTSRRLFHKAVFKVRHKVGRYRATPLECHPLCCPLPPPPPPPPTPFTHVLYSQWRLQKVIMMAGITFDPSVGVIVAKMQNKGLNLCLLFTLKGPSSRPQSSRVVMGRGGELDADLLVALNCAGYLTTRGYTTTPTAAANFDDTHSKEKNLRMRQDSNQRPTNYFGD
jgi:hypothetical protein